MLGYSSGIHRDRPVSASPRSILVAPEERQTVVTRTLSVKIPSRRRASRIAISREREGDRHHCGRAHREGGEDQRLRQDGRVEAFERGRRRHLAQRELELRAVNGEVDGDERDDAAAEDQDREARADPDPQHSGNGSQRAVGKQDARQLIETATLWVVSPKIYPLQPNHGALTNSGPTLLPHLRA